ncbi:MAG: hypothetical protein HYY51_03340 [Candidatus Magasanikbacteria bacterium]|nr:hypothetical protein [Candidatus Magasanikbacteria bacterium]
MNMSHCEKKSSKKTFLKVWFYRIFGFFLIYLSLSFPKNVSLTDTKVLTKIKEWYPNWPAFLSEIVFSIAALGLFALLGNLLYILAKKHRTASHILNLIQKGKNRFTRSFILSLCFLARWTVGIIAAGILWFSFVKLLGEVYWFVSLPLYTENSALVVAGIFGIALCIESLDMWSEPLRKRLCMLCGE